MQLVNLGMQSCLDSFIFSCLGGVSPQFCPSPILYGFRAYLLSAVGLSHDPHAPATRRIVYLTRNTTIAQDDKAFECEAVCIMVVGLFRNGLGGYSAYPRVGE
jgi:hypothetical protein